MRKRRSTDGRKKRSILKTAVSVIIVAAAIFGGGFYTGRKSLERKAVTVQEDPSNKLDLKLPGEVQKRIVTIDEVEAKIYEIGELSTYAGEYTVTLGKDETRYLLDNIELPWTTNSIEITCTGIVKVGYDLKKINVEVGEDKIYIGLPELKLNDNYVIWDTVDVSEKNNINNPIEFSQYQELVSEIEEKGLKDVEEEGIYESAEKNVKKVIEAFLSEFVDYTIVYM